MYLSIKVIRIAVTAALPRIAGDASKVARWADLFAGWLAPSTGKATAITAPTTGTASNVARRAWKNNAKLKGSENTDHFKRSFYGPETIRLPT